MPRERSVGVANDGGRWRFISQGKPLPFEEPAAYEDKQVRGRFTPEMLARYCEALGIRVFDAGFYGPDATLVETIYPPSVTEGWVVKTLAQAQEDIGLKVDR